MSKNKKCNGLTNSLLFPFLITFLLFSCNVSEKDKSVKMRIDSINETLRNKAQLQKEDEILKEAQKNGYNDSITFKKRLTNYIEQELDYYAFGLGDSIKIVCTQLSIQDINFKSYIKADIGAIDTTSKPHKYKEIISGLSDKNIVCLINEKVVKLSFDENSFRNTLPQQIAYFKHNGVPYMLVSFYIFSYASSFSYFKSILFRFDNHNNLIANYLIDTVHNPLNYETLGDFDGNGTIDCLVKITEILPKHKIAVQKLAVYDIVINKELFSKFILIPERYD